MKPCTITPVRPIRDMEVARRELQAWTRFVIACLIVGALAVGLVGCDSSTDPAVAAKVDSIVAAHPAPAAVRFEICATGLPPVPSCAACASEGPYTWGVDMILSTGDTVYTPYDSVQCKAVGAFPDTTRFRVDGVWQKGEPIEMWMVVAGDSVPFRWKGRVDADSLRTPNWEDAR